MARKLMAVAVKVLYDCGSNSEGQSGAQRNCVMHVKQRTVITFQPPTRVTSAENAHGFQKNRLLELRQQQEYSERNSKCSVFGSR